MTFCITLHLPPTFRRKFEISKDLEGPLGPQSATFEAFLGTFAPKSLFRHPLIDVETVLIDIRHQIRLFSCFSTVFEVQINPLLVTGVVLWD